MTLLLMVNLLYDHLETHIIHQIVDAMTLHFLDLKVRILLKMNLLNDLRISL